MNFLRDNKYFELYAESSSNSAAKRDRDNYILKVEHVQVTRYDSPNVKVSLPVSPFGSRVFISHSLFTQIVGGNSRGVRWDYKWGREKWYNIESEEVKRALDWDLKYPARNALSRQVKNRNKRIVEWLRSLNWNEIDEEEKRNERR